MTESELDELLDLMQINASNGMVEYGNFIEC